MEGLHTLSSNLRPDRRQLDEDDVAEALLRVVRDSDRAYARRVVEDNRLVVCRIFLCYFQRQERTMLLQGVLAMEKRAGRTDECTDERLQTVCSCSWEGPPERGRGARCGTEGGEHGHGLCVVVEVVLCAREPNLIAELLLLLRVQGEDVEKLAHAA